jgi:hypothetical protein
MLDEFEFRMIRSADQAESESPLEHLLTPASSNHASTVPIAGVASRRGWPRVRPDRCGERFRQWSRGWHRLSHPTRCGTHSAPRGRSPTVSAPPRLRYWSVRRCGASGTRTAYRGSQDIVQPPKEPDPPTVGGIHATSDHTTLPAPALASRVKPPNDRLGSTATDSVTTILRCKAAAVSHGAWSVNSRLSAPLAHDP